MRRLGAEPFRGARVRLDAHNPFTDGQSNYSVIVVDGIEQPLDACWDALRAETGARYSVDASTLRLMVPHEHFRAPSSWPAIVVNAALVTGALTLAYLLV